MMKTHNGWTLGLSAALLLAAFALEAGCPAGEGGCDDGAREQKRTEAHARKGKGGGGEDAEAPGKRLREKHQEMRQQHQQMKEKQQAQREAMHELLEQYRDNPTDELRAEIREKLAAQFQQRRAHLAEQLERIDAEREKVKQQLADLEKDDQALVDRKFEELTSGQGKGRAGKGSKDKPQE